MPGSVAAASTVGTFPVTLYKSYAHTREYPVYSNDYRAGENQRSLLGSTSRKRWTCTKRLSAADLATLRTFYVTTTQYGLKPFVFAPIDDASSVNARFEGQWDQETDFGMTEVSLNIVEVA